MQPLDEVVEANQAAFLPLRAATRFDVPSRSPETIRTAAGSRRLASSFCDFEPVPDGGGLMAVPLDESAVFFGDEVEEEESVDDEHPT